MYTPRFLEEVNYHANKLSCSDTMARQTNILKNQRIIYFIYLN